MKARFSILSAILLAVSVCSAQTGNGTTSPAFTMEQSVSDGAQRSTLAFAGLAMMTGNLSAQSFFPPGKVADYTGFQYLRDNDPDSMGHNTSFLTRIANNVLYILNDSQLAQLKTLALAQQDQIALYGYKRFALMKAFRRLLEGDVPAGTTGLDLLAVKRASRELYLLDGQISFDRALLYANIFSSMNATQTDYLDAMKGNGFNSWPDISNDLVKEKTKGLTQGEGVAVMTYAGDLFSWYAGSLDADVYFCPERHGTYFGSFYIKDAPAIGHEGYSIDEQLTATAGAALCDSSKGYVTAAQATAMSSLVSAQRNKLYASDISIVSTRTQIATLLRGLLVSTASSASVNTQVLALSEIYGELDGENNFNYATVFASVYSTLTDVQLASLAALRKSIMSGTYADGTAFDFSVCTTPFLYSAAITNQAVLAPYIADTDYLFSSAAESAAPWRQQYFGTAENAGDAADSSDPDGDGLTNAKEYAFGTNPMTADTGGLLDLAPDGNRLALTFFGRQSAGAGYVGLTRHYCVETTSNLTSTISWTPVTGFSDVAGEDKTISLKLPVTGTKCFFRLRAWLQ